MSDSVSILKFTDGKSINSENFADYAKLFMKKRADDFPGLTTTKLRSIYSLITNIYTKINVPEDYGDRKSDIQYLKVKMAYEAGREKEVKTFLEKTYLMAMLDRINSYDTFMTYCRYAESLVAYFKFYGGKDN